MKSGDGARDEDDMPSSTESPVRPGCFVKMSDSLAVNQMTAQSTRCLHAKRFLPTQSSTDSLHYQSACQTLWTT